MIEREDPDEGDALTHPPDDPNSPVIKFAHEMWRAMEDSDPGGGEARKHGQGDEFFNDRVWTEGERPIRDELGIPRGDDPRQQAPQTPETPPGQGGE